MKEIQKLIKELKNEIIKTLSKSTIHGISKVVKSKNLPRKLVWTFLVLVSYTYCAYSVMRNISDFLR